MAFIRRDIWDLEESQEWHPITLAYARAVATLRQRDPLDPTSWSYQGAIHGTQATPERPGWNQCQHGGWYFLPWHRLYLHYFERIVRSAVISDGGPDDWALPYWDYDRGGTSNTLPPAFRNPLMPDGSENPLYVRERRRSINAGAPLPEEITSPALALGMPTFTPLPRPGFGGGRTRVAHFWTEPGGLEQTPHNDIHNAVGGPGGWMADPDLAALDPIFWLHHANIDRLWSVWLADATHLNPSDAAWLNQQFALFDEAGNREVKAARDALDTVEQLDYEYDSGVPSSAALERGGVAMPERARSVPEMIGATDQPLALTGTSASVDVHIDERAGTDRLSAEAETPKRLYLSVEHIDAETAPGTVYGVYLEAPEGAGETRRHVGNVSLFGVEKLHRSRAGDDGPHELRLTFDVTDIAREIGYGEVRGKTVRVSFEPLMRDEADAAFGAEPTPPIRIGRVSFFTE